MNEAHAAPAEVATAQADPEPGSSGSIIAAAGPGVMQGRLSADSTSHAPIHSRIASASGSGIVQLPVPWRVTLDSNPDDCNLSCIMCEQHSVHSDAQAKRAAAGIRRRRMDPALIPALLSPLPIGSHGLREVIPSTMGESPP